MGGGGQAVVTAASSVRVYSDQPLGPGDRSIRLTAEERHHLGVRRVAPGDPVEVLDGVGGIGSGTLEADGTIVIERVTRAVRPPDLTLLVGAADRDRFFWLVEKCVEVGVTALVPVETERSRQVATRVRPEHLDKMRRRAREALKQCGGAWGLEIGPITDLAVALGAVAADRRWLADPRGTPPDLGAPGATVAAAIGPEGGFTEVEVEAVQAAGFALTRLGLRTLRFETAALAAAMIVRLEGRERDG